MRKWDIRKLSFSFLCALALVHCISMCEPVIPFPKATVSIRVHSGNEENGFSEVWIVDNQKSVDLRQYHVENLSGGHIDYREKEEFNYAYDMLVLYGDNIGAEISFPYDVKSAGITFYEHANSAVIEIDSNGQMISLYSPTEKTETISLPGNRIYTLGKGLVYIVLTLLGTALLYHALLRVQSFGMQEGEKIGGAPPERLVSIDVVRSFAAFSVCWVHIFLQTGYYDVPLVGKTMFILTVLRWCAFLAVPLFMILSGYLCINRVNIERTFKKIPYFIIQALIFVSISQLLVNGNILKELSWATRISYFIGDNAAWAWYVGMYTGLLFLMPFLNRMWKSLDKKEKQALLLALLFIGSTRSYFDQIFYTYWAGLYPLTYYFIGAYLREYPIRLSTGKSAVLFCAVILLQTVTCMCYTTEGGLFRWDYYGGFQSEYNAFWSICAAALLFTIFSRIRISNKRLVYVLSLIGRNTLGIYLLEGTIKTRLLFPISPFIRRSISSVPWWILYAALTCIIGAIIAEAICLTLAKIQAAFGRFMMNKNPEG